MLTDELIGQRSGSGRLRVRFPSTPSAKAFQNVRLEATAAARTAAVGDATLRNGGSPRSSDVWRWSANSYLTVTFKLTCDVPDVVGPFPFT